MHTHGRNGAWLAGLMSALALLVPSTALAEHDLKVYKAEAHVDLTADDKAVTVSCRSGDHALDGMWRIDHADYDDYKADLDNLRTAVDVLEARATSDSTYSFRFVKNAIGRVQLKVFVTCLGDRTEGGAHDHAFTTAFYKADGTTQANTLATMESSGPVAVAGTGSTTTPVTTTIATGAASCPAGFILVTPGFDTGAINDPGPPVVNPADPPEGFNRLYKSSGGSSMTDWEWKFDNSALPSGWTTTITTYWRCLRVKVSPGPSGEKHKLVRKFKTKTFNPAPSGVSEGRIDCGSHYKGIVAGFAIDDPVGGLFSAAGEFDNVYYLGMDPRIKQRAFRFLNKHTSGAFTVPLTLTCLNYRTT